MRPASSLLVLSRTDVVDLLPMSRALEVVRDASREYSIGHADIPLRTRFECERPPQEVLIMPGFLPARAAVGVKFYSGALGGDDRAEPTYSILFRDLESGVEALIDAGYLTEVRTGALTGIACELLAPAAATRLGLIGTGRLAAMQLDAVVATTAVHDTAVWSRTPERLQAFVVAARQRHPTRSIVAAANVEKAVEGADIVIAATTATDPVVDDRLLGGGALVCSVGSYRPGHAELAPATVARARAVVVDTRRGALNGPSDIAGPIRDGLLPQDMVIELGELLIGTRTLPAGEGIRIFKSVGFAALDVLAAKAITDAAVSNGRGVALDIH